MRVRDWEDGKRPMKQEPVNIPKAGVRWHSGQSTDAIIRLCTRTSEDQLLGYLPRTAEVPMPESLGHTSLSGAPTVTGTALSFSSELAERFETTWHGDEKVQKDVRVSRERHTQVEATLG